MTKTAYMLEMKGVSKHFPGVKALDEMTLQVRPGSVHIIMGENGAGKSTLMKILMGLHQADAGEILFQGKPALIRSPADAQRLGISMIHQELNTVPDLTVMQYLFLGREIATGAMLNDREMARQTRAYLDELHIAYSEHTKMKDLTQSETQLCEIAKAVSCNASLIIMDEPTSAIADKEVEILFQTIRKLKQDGKAIIYITHKLDEISAIGDDVTVLRDGKWIASHPISQVTNDEIITMMIGRELKDQYPKEAVSHGAVGFQVEHLCQDGVFEDINFHVRKGEIIGFAGLIGAGRTEVVRSIFGLDPITSGKLCVDGEAVHIRHPKDAIASGIALVPEDRKNIGLVLSHSIAENISLPNYPLHHNAGFLRKREIAQISDALCQKLGVKTPSINAAVDTLSGGNQQKVVLAKWLDRDIKVLILDEPTRGIDVGAKSEIYRLMVQLAQQGLCIIMISSELPEVLSMSDRVYVMREGRITGELSAKDATQEAIMQYSI